MAANTSVTPFTRLHLRGLQAWLHLTYWLTRDHIDSLVTVSSGFLASLTWWSNPNSVMVGTRFTPSVLRATIVTDISLTEWGAHLYHHTAQDTWTPQEGQTAYKLTGTQSSLLGLQSLPCPHSLTPCANPIRQYKQTGRSEISSPLSGGSQTGNLVCQKSGYRMATYFPGTQNSLEDKLSRSLSTDHEWEIHDTVLANIFTR